MDSTDPFDFDLSSLSTKKTQGGKKKRTALSFGDDLDNNTSSTTQTISNTPQTINTTTSSEESSNLFPQSDNVDLNGPQMENDNDDDWDLGKKKIKKKKQTSLSFNDDDINGTSSNVDKDTSEPFKLVSFPKTAIVTTNQQDGNTTQSQQNTNTQPNNNTKNPAVSSTAAKRARMNATGGMFDSGHTTGPTLHGQFSKRSNDSSFNNTNTSQPNTNNDNEQQPYLSFDCPLLDPLSPDQLVKPNDDYQPTTRYDDNNKNNKKTSQDQSSFNRAYYSMEESGSTNDFDDDIYRYSSDKPKVKQQLDCNNQPLNGNTEPLVTAANAQKAARSQQRNNDASGWEEERRAMALGLVVVRDLEELQGSNAEEVPVVYPDEKIPKFLYHYNTLLNNEVNRGGNDSNNSTEKTSALSMFKQEKVQVCQKMDGHMMRLAKEGSASIMEYRQQKDRLKNGDRFWEAKGNSIGSITGESNMVTKEDQKRISDEEEQKKNELGGYVGAPEWIEKQLALDQILYRDEYKREKEAMMKKLAISGGTVKGEVGQNNKDKTLEPTQTSTKQDLSLLKSELIPTTAPTIPPNDSLQPTSIFNPTTQKPTDPIIQEPINNHLNESTQGTFSTSSPGPTSIEEDPELTLLQRDELKRLEIKRVRDNLPAFWARHEFLNHVRENQVVIVVGETGSGKTTQLAQYLYETGYTTIPSPPPGYTWTPNENKLMENDDGDDNTNNDNTKSNNTTQKNQKNSQQQKSPNPPMDEYTRYQLRAGQRIVVTQPRRVAATSVATRVAEEMGVELGTTVGYTIRFEECTSPYTAVKFLTDGILLRETLSSPNLNQYSVVIIDEAHERSLNSDILFGLLRTILTRRSDLKLIVTSATMNADAFSQFFGNAPIMHISGRTFPVDLNFNASVPADYILAAAKKVLQCHLQHVIKTSTTITDPTTNLPSTIDHLQPTGDILVFMTGQDDVEATCYYIRKELEDAGVKMPLWVLPITSTLPQDVQSRIFSPSSIRKCIVATNIAETSLTIDGVRYVIDTGLYKLKTYNAQIGMDMLTVTPISQASANQRKGRAGRTSEGICYRLYRSEEFFNELLPNNIAEIHRTNLSNVILTLKAVFNQANGGSNNIFNFPFLEKPSTTSLLSALHQLYLLGAIDENEEITPIGSLMTLLPLDPPLSRLLIESIRLQCFSEVLTLAAMLTVPNVYYRPHGKDEQYSAAHRKFAMGEGDFITLVNIYNMWAFYGYREQWCIDNYFQYKGLTKAREIRSQLVNLVKSKEFLEKVLLCFSTTSQRDNAMKVAQERHKVLNDVYKNSIGNNRQGNQLGKRGAMFRDVVDEDDDNNNKINKSSHLSIHQQPQQQAPQPPPSIKSLYYDNLPAYHTFQALLQNTTHILTSKTTAAQWNAIRKCICAGYFINASKLLSGTSYQNIRSGVGCEVHSTATLGSGHDFIIYQDIVVTTKNFMRMVSVVEPEWLVEYGSKLYKLKYRKAIPRR